MQAPRRGYDGAVFSYQHSFHAGNHGDVLKHVGLVAVLRYLIRKPAPLLLVDTHAGAGLYRLDSAAAAKSGEASEGVHKLQAWMAANSAAAQATVLQDYLALVQRFNRAAADDALRVYPGSPAIMHALMTGAERKAATTADRLSLFEWHPNVQQRLREQVSHWTRSHHITVHGTDGFAGLKGQLPPPPARSGPRRALVLIDPAYEVKTDYAAVWQTVEDALVRFATGVYLIWYPIVAQPGSQRLPNKLRALAQGAGRQWLHATLDVGHPPHTQSAGRGLSASGLFVVNPPYVLAAQLQAALPLLVQALGRGSDARWQVEQGAESGVKRG